MSSLLTAAGLSPADFLAHYWQKQPLLIRQGMPEVVGLLVPDELRELATQPEVTCRLVTQTGTAGEIWKVQDGPFKPRDFRKLPPLWSLLVQAVDHWSLEVADLWPMLDFLPAWRRDDIMVSLAPAGGSVGEHFDQYDVFLVQGYGSRRWQLGQWCDADTPLQPDQPLRLLTSLGTIQLDVVLHPGDVLYVPPGLAHYGVAVDDCLTYSFGFRMPSPGDLIERLADHAPSLIHRADQPVRDREREPAAQPAQVGEADLLHLRQQVQALLDDPALWRQAIMSVLSEPAFADHLPEPDDLAPAELREALESGQQLRLEPAACVLLDPDQLIWVNGDLLADVPLQPALLPLLAGQTVSWADQPLSEEILHQLTLLYQAGALLLEDTDD